MRKPVALWVVGAVVVLATGVRLDGDAGTERKRHTPKRVMRGASVPDDIEPPEVLSLEQLRAAASSGRAGALSDLAAALLTQAERSGRPEPAVEAVSVARQAIAKNPWLGVAHFNLAQALDRIGLTTEARAAFEEAAAIDPSVDWAGEAERRAFELRQEARNIDRDQIRRYVAATAAPESRRLLRPYLRTPASSPSVRDADARLRRAANIYSESVDPFINRVATRLKTLSADADATHYYMAGAYYAAGRKVEAVVWLASLDNDIRRASGQAGTDAQLVWEAGLQLIVDGQMEDALHLFESEREPAVFFDELAQTVRAYLVADAMFERDRDEAFRHAGESSSLLDVQRALAPDAAILRYTTVSATEIVVFVIRRDSIELVTLPVLAQTLVASIDRMRRAEDEHVGPVVSMPHDLPQILAASADRLRRVEDKNFGAIASELHDFAFAALSEKLQGITTIAIVPTRDLDGIPFGALFDSARGEYLAERFTIVHASTAGAAVDASRRARDLRDTSLLAIGASRFDYSEAEPLPSVDREALDVAAQSRCSRVFSGAEATPDAVERELAESAIIHYAGHIVGRGADARMLLAPSRGRDSLSAKEIAAFRLKKPRVAVLAACRGASIGSSMADAFLEAGVPTVIASAYNLDDAEAPATMRRLHALLGNGADAAEALRQTTIHELRAGRGVPVSIRFHATGGASSLIR